MLIVLVMLQIKDPLRWRTPWKKIYWGSKEFLTWIFSYLRCTMERILYTKNPLYRLILSLTTTITWFHYSNIRIAKKGLISWICELKSLIAKVDQALTHLIYNFQKLSGRVIWVWTIVSQNQMKINWIRYPQI